MYILPLLGALQGAPKYTCSTHHGLCLPLCLQLLDGRVSLHDVEVLQPSPAASHPYLSPQQHPDLLVEAVSSCKQWMCDCFLMRSRSRSSKAAAGGWATAICKQQQGQYQLAGRQGTSNTQFNVMTHN